MLWQLHHQNEANRKETVFCSQKDFESKTDWDKWFKETRDKFPLPDGYEWLCCTEKSEHFIKQAKTPPAAKG